MARNVTRRQAEAALAAIKRQFSAWLVDGDGPTLYEPGFQTDAWAIGWEEGPYEWTYLAFDGGRAAEFGFVIKPVKRPAGVHTEAVNHWCLGLYPEW